MAISNLLGRDAVLPKSPGHDTCSLGPSDTSDSGSDASADDGWREGADILPDQIIDLPEDADDSEEDDWADSDDLAEADDALPEPDDET